MRPLLRRGAAILACSLACSWAALVLVGPWLASSGGIGLRVSAVSYLVGGVVCHQQAARSFHLAGAQLPVCARCTALYLGGAVGLLAGVVLPAIGRRDPLSMLAARWSWRHVLAVAVLPILATVALEWTGLWSAPNAWRAAASLPAAWGAGALVAESLSFRVTL